MRETLRKASARERVCLFRGESCCFPLVSSGLFRNCEASRAELFDMGALELEILKQVRGYTPLTSDEEILAELQHFGGKTNLIDFTEDFLISMYFACAGGGTKNGRIILHWPDLDRVIRPPTTNNRVVFQKSVFVRPTRGFIVPDECLEIVVVPGDLKEAVLSYLARFHGVNEKSVYNDIHGYVRHQNPDRIAYVGEFHKTRAEADRVRRFDLNSALVEKRVRNYTVMNPLHWHQRDIVYVDRNGAEARLQIEVEHDDSSATGFYIYAKPFEIVELCTNRVENVIRRDIVVNALCLRGEAQLFLKELDLANADFEKALDLDIESAYAHQGRAHVRCERGQYDAAIIDLNEALRLHGSSTVLHLDRGIVQLAKGELEEALNDFDKVIDLSIDDYFENFGREGLFFRAVSRCMTQDWVEAIEDLKVARREGLLLAASFQSVFGDVDAFEAKHRVRLPSSIKTELCIPEQER